jgi:voltage-gated potassium channel
MLHIHHRKLIIIGIIFLTSWLVGTLLIHRFEAGYPIGESYFDALYFTIITTATIGFGDLVPMTLAGKIVTMAYAIFYVPLFLYAMSLVFQIQFDRIRRADERMERDIENVEKDVEIILDEMPRKRKMIAKK